MEYVHMEKSKTTNMMVRLWHTEVYMTSFFNGECGSENNGSSDKLVIFIKVSYSWNKNKFLEEDDAIEPKPTAPSFIYDLLPLNPHQDGLTYSFKKTVGLVESEAAGENLWKLINASQRKIHILVIVMQVYPSEKNKLTFLKKLGSRIVGKSVAFLVCPTSPAYKILRGLGFDMKQSTVYICPPLIREETRPQYVKIPESYTPEALDALNERLCQFFYRNYFYVEDDAIISLEEIRIELLKQYRKQMVEAHLKERDKFVEDSTKDYDALKSKYESLRKEQDDTITEWANEEQRRKNVEDELRSKKRDLCDLHQKRDAELLMWQKERLRLSASKEELMEAGISSVSCNNILDRVTQFIPLLQDRLEFTNKAKKSLESCPRDMERYVLPALFVLYNRFWPALSSSEGQQGKLENLIEDVVFTYAANESSSTKTNPTLIKDRTVKYDNREFCCFRHLKLKRGDGRVYFEYDNKTKKIILCSIGQHLDTAGTRRRGL
jgi:hypothetical protein